MAIGFSGLAFAQIATSGSIPFGQITVTQPALSGPSLMSNMTDDIKTFQPAEFVSATMNPDQATTTIIVGLILDELSRTQASFSGSMCLAASFDATPGYYQLE